MVRHRFYYSVCKYFQESVGSRLYRGLSPSPRKIPLSAAQSSPHSCTLIPSVNTHYFFKLPHWLYCLSVFVWPVVAYLFKKLMNDFLRDKTAKVGSKCTGIVGTHPKFISQCLFRRYCLRRNNRIIIEFLFIRTV